ncbi:hypothetical protein LCGC14_1231190 [marine sediment metagenome]|uniref:Sulfotransferase domain-containing protein n=1 Tax=marine sediment metagenome TaxID=412755 RepID=A0A0F9LVP3_9ZZZZ
MIVIVVGMHRSGTSALAGTLQANGICMGEEGDFFPPPMKENPKGFFENRRFRTINDHLLREWTYRVKSFDPAVPKWCRECSGSIHLQMDAVVRHYHDRYDAWGWKDPRTCLTLRPWLDTLLSVCGSSHIKVLLTVRDAKDITTSMLERGNKEKTPGQFEALTREYYYSATTALTDARVDYHMVTFVSLMQDTAACVDKIAKYLDHPLPKIDFVDRRVSKATRRGESYMAADGGGI